MAFAVSRLPGGFDGELVLDHRRDEAVSLKE
jgi:hypothetical protein